MRGEFLRAGSHSLLRKKNAATKCLIQLAPGMVAAAFVFAGCATTPQPQTGTLQCRYPWEAGGFMGMFSFDTGELTPPLHSVQVDLLYYFDQDDCRQGAIISGQDDYPGFLFPIGHQTWNELMRLKPPSDDAKSVAAITPLTKNEEGMAFWVKRKDGEFVLTRIKTVQPASHEDLKFGLVPTLELEWIRPGTNRHGPS